MKKIIIIILSVTFIIYSSTKVVVAAKENPTFQNHVNKGITKDIFPIPGSGGNQLQESPAGSSHVALVSQLDGRSKAIALQGGFAYIGISNRMSIFNISDVAHPSLVGHTPDLPFNVSDIAVAGGYAYILSREILSVADVSLPSAPVLITSLILPEEAYQVVIQGNLAYIAGGLAGLRIIDISNPHSPYEVGFYDTPINAYGVAVTAGYAYIADGYGGGMRIIDVSTPATPIEVGFYELPEPMFTGSIDVEGDYAYLSTNWGYHGGSLNIVNVSNPSAPVWVGGTGWTVNIQSVDVVGNYAYVAIQVALEIVDISDPSTPLNVGYIQTPAMDIAVSPSADYVFLEGNGLRIIDISNPSSPALTGVYDSMYEASDLVVSGDIAYITAFNGNMFTVDISQPENPTQVGFLETETYALLYDIAISGDYAFMANGGDGLIIVDVSDPGAPVEVGRDPVYALGVAVISDTAFVVGNQFTIIDVSDPTAPIERGSVPMPGPDSAWGVAAAGNYAYVAAGFNGLRIIDISNPYEPFELSSYDLEYVSTVEVIGNLIYAVGSDFWIIDVSNPASPVEVGSFALSDYADGLSIDGTLAYVAQGLSGLRIIDISQPTAPVEVGYYDSYQISDVAVSNGYAFTAAGWDGLVILRYAPFTVSLPLVMSTP